jgi:glycosyltransferase involved in cell wall biosynthesis
MMNSYKHQWVVAEAIAMMLKEGLPVTLDWIGPTYEPALRRLGRSLRSVNQVGSVIRYIGKVRYDYNPSYHTGAALCLYASSCETFGLTLLEAMASDTPIACSRLSAMPEIRGDAGVYFDPEDPAGMTSAIRKLAENPELRAWKEWAAYEQAHEFLWKRCTDDTFRFFAEVTADHRSDSQALS